MYPPPSTVLHVDDDPAGRFALSEALRRAGFRVREAATGREALDLAAAERTFGYPKEEVLGRCPLDLLVPPSARPHVEDVVRRLRAGDMEANSVNENVTRDGRTIVCEWYNTPLHKPDGTVDGFVSMVLDVTERRRLEQQYLQAQKMEAVGQLAG